MQRKLFLKKLDQVADLSQPASQTPCAEVNIEIDNNSK